MIDSLQHIKKLFKDDMKNILILLLQFSYSQKPEDTTLLDEFIKMEKEMAKKIDDAIEKLKTK